MIDSQVAEIRDVFQDSTIGTHWEGCHTTHPKCALKLLLDGVQRLQSTIKGFESEVGEVDQILGRALGFPEYNPLQLDSGGGVCTGEHTIVTLAEKAAKLLRLFEPQSDHPYIRPLPLGSRWRHVRKGDLYDVIAVGYLERDASPVVIYRGVKSGVVWVRPTEEFLDGRFVTETESTS